MSQNSLPDVKALLFDVFGTVVDWESSVTKLLESYTTTNGIDVEGASLLDFTRGWRKGYKIRTREIANGGLGPTNIDDLHREILDDLLKSTPDYAALDSVLDNHKRKEMCQFWHQLDGWPDASPGLLALRASASRQVILGTLSNGSARLLVDVARHASLPWDIVFSGDLLKSYKPNAKMYLGACELLDLQPGQVAMVASHIADLRSAASYGLRTIFIPRPTEDTEAEGYVGDTSRDSVRSKADGGEVDAVIKGFEELEGVLSV